MQKKELAETRVQFDKTKEEYDTLEKELTELEKKIETSREAASQHALVQKQLEGLSPSQLKIVSVMDKPSMHVDDIINSSGFSPAKVLADLTLLQIKGYVSQTSGKRFTLNIKMK